MIPIMPSMTNTNDEMINAEVKIYVNDIPREIDPTTILVDLSKQVSDLMELIEKEIALFKSDNVFAPGDVIESVNSNFLGDPENLLNLMDYPKVVLGDMRYMSEPLETATLYINLRR
jgi:c-di-GMP-related signal transduction protein